MKISKQASMNAAGVHGANSIPPGELELSDGSATGIGVSIFEPSRHGPHSRACINLTPAGARKVGDSLIAYADRVGSVGEGASS